MFDLLPGDRLWGRFRVESVGANGAWLARLPGRAASGAGEFGPSVLLLALERQAGPAPLAELLCLAGAAVRLRTRTGQPQVTAAPEPGTPRPERQHAVPGAADQPSAFVELPLLGHVAWIGDPARGGIALVEAPVATPLAEKVAAGGAFSPRTTLALLTDFSASLEAFAQIDGLDSAGRSLWRVLVRLLHPGAIVLRSDRACLGVRLGLAEPANALAPPRWAEFLAPELYRGECAGQAACVFGVARLGAFLMGAIVEQAGSAGVSPAAPSQAGQPAPQDAPETAWFVLAEWACGKRDPAREFLEDANATGIPQELRALLAACLSQDPANRPDTLGKLHAALEALAGCPWNAATAETAEAAPGSAAGPGGEGAAQAGARGSTTSTGAAAQLENMAVVAAGAFLSGEQKTPRTLRAFAIDTRPVTEGDYKRFLSRVCRAPRPGGPGAREPQYDTHPVTRVTWYEANEYAEFYGKRLPTIYEWEKAARGTDGRKFPFGSAYRAKAPPRRAGGSKGREVPGTAPVGHCPAEASPYGVLDTVGNVLQWTSTARRAGERLFRAVKGSCYLDGSPELARCTSVQYVAPESAEPHIGFRCVKDLD
ncbi:MAG: SUMF1/EgtB/PvdO family nonheme iron enzyme [Planctomycetota bacterium]